MTTPRETMVDIGDLAPGTTKGIVVEGRPIALVNLEGRIHALLDQCTHMKSRLSNGYVEGPNLVCPAHFGSFDIATGQAVARPCRLPVPTFAVRQEGSCVWITLDGEGLTAPQYSAP